MDDSYSFGAWVRQRRKILDLTQAALARLIGVAAITIQKIEADERRPSHQVAELLASHLHVPAHERALFLAAARGERAPDQLPVPTLNLPERHIHLPTQLTSFLGRAREIGELSALLQKPDVRLVTLIGAGGTGKTRLALRVAEELASDYLDGVWFVDLAPISDPEQVAGTCMQALSIPEVIGVDPRARIQQWLQSRQLLLILDNYEQVVNAASLVADLLGAAPDITIVVTSRVPLRLIGEQEYPLAPLSQPIAGATAIEHITQYDAVALLISRTQAVRPDFRITKTNAPAVADICARLDGLPLAIELAAARMRMFNPEQLLNRLMAAQLQTLTGGARNLPARQQTIRATIDWSYQLLNPPQQRLFARLGVFVGGWTLAAAEAIGSQGDMDVVRELDALVQHSLVRVIEANGDPRYNMLETIREYALERLREQGDAGLVHERHTAYFVAFAEEAEPQLRGRDELAWLDRLDTDYANFQAALAWCLEAPDTTETRRIQGWHMSATLWWYWNIRGHFRDWRHWVVDQVEQAEAPPPELRGRLYLAAALITHRVGGQAQAVHLFEQSQLLFQACGSIWWYAYGLGEYGWLTFMKEGDQEHAEQIIVERLLVAQQINDPWLVAEAYIGYGDTINEIGKTKDALSILTQGLQLARTVGNSTQIASALQELGECRLSTSTFAMAGEYFRECLGLQRALSDMQGTATALWGLGNVAFYTGDVETNRVFQRERLRIEQELDNTVGVASVLADLAASEWSAGNVAAAEAYCTQSLALGRADQNEEKIVGALVVQAHIVFVQDDLDQVITICHEIAERAPAINHRLALTFMFHLLGWVALRRNDAASARSHITESFSINPFAHNLVYFIQHLEDTAALLSIERQLSLAPCLWGAAEALREQIGAPIWPVERPRYERLVADARSQCDPDAWEAAWNAGLALSQEQATEELRAILQIANIEKPPSI